VQATDRLRLTSNNPEFDGIEVTDYEQHDQTGGTGTHRGYAVFVLRSGEKLWVKYEGVHYTAGESRFQGVFHFISGTGKYSAIHGGGPFGRCPKSPRNRTLVAQAHAQHCPLTLSERRARK